MKKEDLINIISSSPVCQTSRKYLEKMSKLELEDMYAELEDAEQDYYNYYYNYKGGFNYGK